MDSALRARRSGWGKAEHAEPDPLTRMSRKDLLYSLFAQVFSHLAGRNHISIYYQPKLTRIDAKTFVQGKESSVQEGVVVPSQ